MEQISEAYGEGEHVQRSISACPSVLRTVKQQLHYH